MASSEAIERVTRVRNPNYKRSGIKSYAFVMNKYMFQPTLEGPFFTRQVAPHVKVMAKRNSSGAVVGHVDASDIQNDSEYLCPVTIGTPGQTFNLDFDTGSSDLWLFSTLLPSSTQKSAGSKHTLFDPAKSSSFKKSTSTWQISYGDGSSASGSTGTDVVSIGGLKVDAQVIELAKNLSDEFAQGEGDGLLGLAWPSINTVTPTQAATPVDNMMKQNLLKQTLFTAHLASWRQSKDTSGAATSDADSGKFITAADAAQSTEGSSFYTFGNIDQDVLAELKTAEADIYYTPVDNSQGFWQFDSASATVAGKTVDRSGNSAIADTGTTLALVDDKTVAAVYAAIPGAKYDWANQGYLFPASTKVEDLPVVTFAVGDKQFAVPKEALSYADAGNGMVYGGIQSRGSMDMDILGDTWLKGIYAIFDQGQQRFGAVQRPDPTGDSIEVPSN